jgi:glycosyltransferase involved in cell wall biosynthesis
MRILYVINSFDPGGAEHGLLTLIENGFFTGHDLHVLAFCRGRGRLAHRAQEILGRRLTIASPAQTLTLAAMIRGAARLAGLLSALSPQTVVLSLKQANVVGRFLLNFFPRIHCIAFEHIGRYRARRGEKLYGFVLRALSGRVDEVWADCADTLTGTRRYFTPRQRREAAVPLFVSDGIAGRSHDYALGAPIRIAAAGRLVERKNFATVIGAVQRLRDKGVMIELDIYGDGPEAARLTAQVAAQDLEGFVRLQGYTADWHKAAAGHDLFVNMSDTEGFCIVVAEAMAAGLPVIATDVGGIRDYGMDRRNMLKLAAPDAVLLAASIELLLADASLRRTLGDEARRMMMEDYSAASLRAAGARILGA